MTSFLVFPLIHFFLEFLLTVFFLCHLLFLVRVREYSDRHLGELKTRQARSPIARHDWIEDFFGSQPARDSYFQPSCLCSMVFFHGRVALFFRGFPTLLSVLSWFRV